MLDRLARRDECRYELRPQQHDFNHEDFAAEKEIFLVVSRL